MWFRPHGNARRIVADGPQGRRPPAAGFRVDRGGRDPARPGSGRAAVAVAAVAGGGAGGGRAPAGHDHRADAPPGDRRDARRPGGPPLSPDPSRPVPAPRTRPPSARRAPPPPRRPGAPLLLS